jgi:CHAT domain-containing protein
LNRAIAPRLAVIASGVLCLAAASLWYFRRGSPPSHAALDVSVGSHRLIEPRLSGVSDYKPFIGTTASASGTPLAASLQRELVRSAAALQDDRSASNPASQHAAGVLDLVLGRTQKAVDLLEQAAVTDTDRDASLSDLAAAYMVRASALDQPIDLIAALDAAERATELNPMAVEALFNRALAWQRLSLPEQAVQAWREYLEKETDPQWAEEAKSSLRRLQAPAANASWPDAKRQLSAAAQRGDQRRVRALVDRFRQEARSFAEEELLLSWAGHQNHGESAAAAADLATARAIGSSLAELSGESMVADSVAAIERALHDDPARLASLTGGFLAYREGLGLMRERQFAKAEAPLRRAAAALRRAASPFAAWASFVLIRCAYQRPDYEEVERRAHELLAEVDERKYPVVTARTRWVLGSSLMSQARHAEALQSFALALAQFERLQEVRNIASVHSLLAGAYNELGDGRSAWRHRALALRGLASFQEPERLRIALTNAAFGALEAGYPRAAVLLQTAAIDLARNQENPEVLANSLLNRASILDRAGLGDPTSDLASARQACDRIPDPGIRTSNLADLLLVQGRFFQRRNPQRALAVLGQALAMFRAGQRNIMIPMALHDRALAWRGLGRDAEAEEDLHIAIEMLENERGAVPAAEQRASFLERGSPVFDAMVQLQTERGREGLAFEYSERRRARLLLDWLSALPETVDSRRFHLETWTQPAAVDALQQRIPDGVAVIAYELLPDRILTWVVRRGSLHQRQVPIRSAEVETRVHRLEQAVGGPEDRLRRASAAVRELLLAPVADLLERDDTVVFVPEGPLYSVPYALLFDTKTGRYLIEERAFALSPSLSIFVELGRQADSQDFSHADVLAIADPAFDSSLFPGLPRLPGAQEEGRALLQLYGSRARLVAGEAAVRESLLAGLKEYRILHVGGHALANSANPLQSSLLLAVRRDRGDSGVLYMRDVVGPADSRTELAVLSACRSAAGAATPGEGVAGLVWPFFSRGVPMVVASLRDVKDRETASLFKGFYRRLAAGTSPLAALRQAQLDELATNRREARLAFGWAAFQLYGTVRDNDSR